MKVLILGWSEIAARRVVPACVALGVARIDVASRSRPVQLPAGLHGALYTDYAAALTASAAELVWVSTRNDAHAALAAAALAAGRHVVIDKPATLTPADTRHLLAQAARGGRLIAEATVYAFHPQIAAARRVFAAAATAPVRITAQFCYPPPAPANFRWRAAHGGGALWDLGPYAVTPGRLFFDAAPQRVYATSVRAAGDEVASGFSLLAVYPGARTLVGHFSMRSEYINRLELTAPGVRLSLEPAFSTPAQQPARLVTSIGGTRGETLVDAADAFACFLDAIRTALDTGDHAPFAAAMLADAQALEQLRAATNG